MAARIGVDDVDAVYAAKQRISGQLGIGIDHAGVKATAQHDRHACCGAFVAAFPFVIGVPRRGFANFAGVFVDGGVNIGCACGDAGAHHRHIQKRRTGLNHDLRPCLGNQGGSGLFVQSIQGVRFEHARLLHMAFGKNRLDDGLALGKSARSDMNLAQNSVVLRAFMRHHMGHTARADDEDVFFHACYSLLLT